MNRWWTRALAILACAALIVGHATAASRHHILIVNLMPAFFETLEATEGRSLPIRVDALKRNLVYPNAAVFTERNERDDRFLTAYLQQIQGTVPALQSFANTVAARIPAYSDAFEMALPKFDPTSVTVYLMPSMLNFDGMTTDANGRHALLIGVDALAGEGLDFGVFLDHEMFHIYHHAVNPRFFVTPSENDLYTRGLYRQLWAEGLATYASKQLNRGVTDAQALASQDLARMSKAQSQQLACFAYTKLGSRDPHDSNLLFASDFHPAGLPPRGGYAVGYWVATELGKTASLSDLADFQGDVLRNDVVRIVGKLCKP